MPDNSNEFSNASPRQHAFPEHCVVMARFPFEILKLEDTINVFRGSKSTLNNHLTIRKNSSRMSGKTPILLE